MIDILTNLESVIDSYFGVSQSDFSTKFIFPLIFIVLTSFVSGIRLYYLSMQGRNRYISLLKRNFPHIEAFLKIKEKFKRMSQVYFLECLFIGFVLSVFILAIISWIMRSFLIKIYYLIEYGPTVLRYIFDISAKYVIPYPLDVYLTVIIVSKFCLVCCSWFESKKLITEKMMKRYESWFESKKPLTEKTTKLYELRQSQIIVYYVFWILLGLNLVAYIFGFFSLYNNSSAINYIDPYPLDIAFFVLIYLGIIVLCLHYTVDLIKKIKRFPTDVIEPITDYHQRHFPYMTLNTDLGTVKGQLKEIHNKSLVTLSEKNVLMIIPWDTVKMMEACYQNECTVFDSGFINEK